jgi:hypothetical protein
VRAAAAPTKGSPLAALQRRAGNQAVARLLALRSQPPESTEKAPELTIERAGRSERVDTSRIPQAIWWFNGAVPTLAPYFPTEAELELGLPAKGTFRYEIAEGASKLALTTGGGERQSETLTDDPSPQVRSRGPSSSASDILLRVRHQPPDGGSASTGSIRLTVRAPHELKLMGCGHSALGAHGYRSLFRLQLLDNLGSPIPYLDVNEDFTPGTLSAGASSHWRAALDARNKGSTLTLGDGTFEDRYDASVQGGTPLATMKPAPEAPRTPLGTQQVGEFEHRWYAGGRTPGAGAQVSDHIGRFFADHGQYFSFLSPPFYVVRPVDCPP